MSDNSHAAMCVYCGEHVIYDTRKVTDMEAAHATIVDHDQHCPKNPLVAERDELASELRSHKEALKGLQAERDLFHKDWGECVRGHERYYRAGYQDGFAECTNGGEYSPDEAWACEQERDDD